MTQFLYVLDPMCSWCWAFSPSIAALKQHYPDINWSYLMGGLAPDNDAPMPAAQQQQIQAIWYEIAQRTGTQFNHDFWKNNVPRRSTYPACRAVIAAETIRPGSSIEMIQTIQEAYYLNALNPSDQHILETLAEQMSLDIQQFRSLMSSDEIQARLEEQIHQSGMLGAQGFPSLFLKTDDRIYPIAYGYSTEDKIIQRVEELLLRGE